MAPLIELHPNAAAPASSNGARYDHIVVSNDHLPCMKFDPTTDQSCAWSCRLSRTPSGTITVSLVGVMASATANSVRAQVQIGAYSPGDSIDLDTTFSLDTADSGGATCPGTAGYPFEITFTLTHVDSWAAGDQVIVRLNRDADQTSGTDDAAGDWCLTGGLISDAA